MPEGEELDRPTVPLAGDFVVRKVTRLESDVEAQRQEFVRKNMWTLHGGIVYRGVGEETVSEGGKRRRADKKSS
jgi:hypothetical protein